jgi:hypothetical protein
MAVVALQPGELQREAAFEHARTCPDCARALQQAERLLALVDAELVPTPPSAETLQRVERAVEREMQPARKQPRLLAGLATAAGAGVVLLYAHHLDPSGAAVAATAALLAVAFAWSGVSSRAAVAAAGACAASLLLAVVAAHSPGLFVRVGVHCVAVELFTACWPLAAVAVAVAGGFASRPSAWTTAALAAAGALAGQAALHLGCEVHTATAHLLVFHFGGVVLAALAGSAVPRLIPAPLSHPD